MRIVHTATMPIQPAERPKPLSRKQMKQEERHRSARRWMEQQERRNFKKALKEFASEINEVREKYYPDFMPVMI